MAKRKRETTDTVIQQRLSSGRGTGRGKDYTPWLLVQDAPSNGLLTRVKGYTTSRVHHVFSQLESRCLFIFDWSEKIVDIREQFPLLPLEETVAIAQECGGQASHRSQDSTSYGDDYGFFADCTKGHWR